MFWVKPLRSVRREHIRVSPSICSQRQASSTSERRYNGRERPLSPARRKSPYRRSVSSSPTKFTPQPIYHVGDFSFDTFPRMMFTARHPSSSTADNHVSSARHRNKERGRALILKYGSAELAATALEAAHLQARTQLERHFHDQKLLSWKISALHEMMDTTRQETGLQLSLVQQHVGISEAAVEQARGIEKALALTALQRQSARAYELAQMYPFRILLKSQSVLFRFVRKIRIESVSRLGREGLALYERQKELCDDLTRYKRTSFVHMNAFEQRYDDIKRASYGYFHHINVANSILFLQVGEVLASARSTPRTVNALALRALRTFVPASQAMRQLIEQSEADVFQIQLRRQSLHYGERQHTYSALHHAFKLTRSRIEQCFRYTARNFERLVIRATIFHRETNARKAKPSLLRHKGAFCEALAKARHGLQVMMRSYHEEFLPLWALRVESMSSSELIRQNRIAHSHWLRCLRSDQRHESRVAELTNISGVLAKALYHSRPGARRALNKKHLDKQACAAMRRLSGLYRQQY